MVKVIIDYLYIYIVKGYSLVASSKADKLDPSASTVENIGDLNREKASLMNELNVLSGESSLETASCLQYIPKDIKVGTRIDLDYKKAPGKIIIGFSLNKSCLIKGTILLSDKLFEGESLFV